MGDERSGMALSEVRQTQLRFLYVSRKDTLQHSETYTAHAGCEIKYNNYSWNTSIKKTRAVQGEQN